MKHNKIISYGAVLIAAIAVIGVAAATLAAVDNQGGPSNKGDQPCPCQADKEGMAVKRQAIDAALAANDYQAWLTAVGVESDQGQKVTADKFPLLVQAYQLEQEAKTKLGQARQIREDLGLKGPGIGKGFGPGRGKGRCPMLDQSPAESN